MTPDLLEDIYQTFEKYGIDRSKLVPVIIDGELKEIYHIDFAESLTASYKRFPYSDKLAEEIRKNPGDKPVLPAILRKNE